MIRRRDESHFANADLLRGHEHLPHELIPYVRVSADVHLGLRLLARDRAQMRLEIIGSIESSGYSRRCRLPCRPRW